MIIKPKILYGAILWAHKCDATVNKELGRLQRLVLIMISGAMRTTPTAGMEVVMDLVPLDLVI